MKKKKFHILVEKYNLKNWKKITIFGKNFKKIKKEKEN